MEILKYGNAYVVDCEICLAKLKVNRSDTKTTGIGYYVICPCCQNKIIVPDDWVKGEEL